MIKSTLRLGHSTYMLSRFWYFFKRNSKSPHSALVSRIKEEIDYMRPLCKASTHKNRTTAFNAFCRFINEMALSHLSINTLSAYHIKAFERWMLDKGYKPNYVALHMRCLRSVFNHINGRGKELLGDVRTSNCQTEKRAVDENTIREIKNMRLPAGSHLALARDIFLFCFLCMGIPLIDAVNLKKSQVKGRTISYRREKTGRLVSIPVGKEISILLQKLSPSRSPYLLPVLSTNDKTEAMRQYKCFFQRYRRALLKISERLDSDVLLTSYTPRHTWASIAYHHGGNLNAIARACGHANANVTYSYISDISNAELVNICDLVIKAIK